MSWSSHRLSGPTDGHLLQFPKHTLVLGGAIVAFEVSILSQIVGPEGCTAITKPSVLQIPMALWGLDTLSQIESELSLIFNRDH